MAVANSDEKRRREPLAAAAQGAPEPARLLSGEAEGGDMGAPPGAPPFPLYCPNAFLLFGSSSLPSAPVGPFPAPHLGQLPPTGHRVFPGLRASPPRHTGGEQGHWHAAPCPMAGAAGFALLVPLWKLSSHRNIRVQTVKGGGETEQNKVPVLR